MKTRRSRATIVSSDNVIKFKYSSEIPHDTTCESLNFDCKLACPNYIGKIDIFRKVISIKKSKFRHLSDRARCEQRWTEYYILAKNTSTFRYLAHIETCEKLGILI